MTRIAAIGEAMAELSLGAPGEAPALGFAGDTLNTAVYLARLMPDARVAFASKLGRDPLSARLRGFIRDQGVATDLLAEDPKRLPGLYAIVTDEDGERSFLYWREASAARAMLSPPALDLDAVLDADLVHLSAITLAVLPRADRDRLIDRLAAFRAAGGAVSFDSNWRPRLWEDAATARDVIGRAWRTATIGFPSLDDETDLWGDRDAQATLDRLAALGLRDGALKRGAAGPLALDGTRIETARAAAVVDTTGAGDAFDAGYLAARLTGGDTAAALHAGHDLALRVIAHRGAILPADAP